MERAQSRKNQESAWGADLKEMNRPGVPKEMNEENGASGHRAHWRPKQGQVPTVKIHQTIERPHLTPVFGTTSPPRGLSGVIRGVAYRYSEDKIRHWVMLMLADRIQMWEGFAEDIGKGRMPMLLPRMEFRTLDKLRNPKARPQALIAIAGLAAAAGALVFLARRRRSGGPTGVAYAEDPGAGAPDLP